VPDVLKLKSLITRCESRIDLLNEYLVSGGITGHQVAEACRLGLFVRVLKELAANGFDEVLGFRRGEAVEVSPGWLPVKGSDFPRVLSAFKNAGVDKAFYDRVSWFRQPTPKVYIYGSGLYVEIPVHSGLLHPLILVRLDDAALGGRFTDSVEIRDVDESVVAALREARYAEAEIAPELFKAMGPREYLKLAMTVREYSLSVYRETGYPVQTLNPYVVEGTTHVLVMKADKAAKHYMPGLLEGDLTPYDPRYSYVSSLYRERPPLFDPRLARLTGMELFTAVASLATSGRKLYEEEGSGLYALDTPASKAELDNLLGPEQHRVLREVIMPRLGEGDELYLITVGAAGKEVYSHAPPLPGYVSTILLAKALMLDGDLLKPVEGGMSGGLPEHLLTVNSGYGHLPDGWFGYHLALKPKPVKLEHGIYLDGETGAGVAVSGMKGKE